ncbi:hypothetical protein NDU88_005465 [Pleurodeles waltl]|uniref:Uncharacterized protein n=1 Tax=Pleurodeles waltl TaxID=8319 RepID=A0AAV7SLW2_PLEWA|nr:hypothetical protein NDU88_005465 [Pleurodeles waltl]
MVTSGDEYQIVAGPVVVSWTLTWGPENEPGDCELRSAARSVNFGLAGRGVPPADFYLQCSTGGDSSTWRLTATPDAVETGRLRQPERSRELGLLHDTLDR